MIVLNCKGCGKPHSAEIGDSIQCDCGRIITVTRPSDSTLSRQPPPAVEYIPPETRSPWVPAPPLKPRGHFVRNWLIPALGLLALVIGIALALLASYSRKTNVVASQVQPPAAIEESTSSSPTPQPTSKPTKLSSPSADASKSPQEPTDPNDSLGIDKFLAQNPNLTATPTPTPRTLRYTTGTNLTQPLRANGDGTLHISNGTRFDAIAKLVDARTNLTVRMVYIQANTNNDIANISSGDYLLKFALGSGYSPDTARFLYAESFMKFDESFDFHQYQTANGVEWTDYDITLHAVVGGNVHASRISAAEFYDR